VNHVSPVNGSMAADVDEVVVYDAAEVIPGRWKNGWKCDAQFEKSLRNHQQSVRHSFRQEEVSLSPGRIYHF
jgi:hypothetical protein